MGPPEAVRAGAAAAGLSGLLGEPRRVELQSTVTGKRRKCFRVLPPSSLCQVSPQRTGLGADPQQDLLQPHLPEASLWFVWDVHRGHLGSRETAVATQQTSGHLKVCPCGPCPTATPALGLPSCPCAPGSGAAAQS